MFLAGGAALAAAAALRPDRAHAAVTYGPPARFSWEALQGWVEALSRKPFKAAAASDPEVIGRIDYDAYQQIRYRADAAILLSPDSYPVELFHVGKYFMEPVRIFIVRDQESREVLYSPELFSYGEASFARSLPPDTGFAGFRVMRSKSEPDWISFLGGSYFRTTGETKQYGLSARGLAVNIGLPEPEEFPRFSDFWIERLEDGDGIMIYALLDSPSICGAYRIRATREHGAITAIDLVLHARRNVDRLGIAPLGSMYWYSKLNRDQARDWRPEIHDSDGLAMWTGAGEHIWRPLNNPPVTKLSSFIDKSPKGFGLLQRERRFEAYEDDGVFYNLRPSVWIEPVSDWGEGSVQLLEIPTDDETSDNIVAFWNPKAPCRAGDRVALSYRMYWRNDVPFDMHTGKVVATRRGMGGRPGMKRRPDVTKYVIDFEGGELGKLENTDGVKLNLSVSRGRTELVSAYRVVGTPRWRAMFDYIADDRETADLRAYLEQNGRALTETWIYQHVEPWKRGA
ncbi:MAG: glucan biosynthesis protein D [Rhodomicrobiaceae bacterium]